MYASDSSLSEKTLTENGALTNTTTGSAVLDFFALGGALRSRSEDERYNLFCKAYIENPQLAIRALFYFRDVRGGQGERDTFRMIFSKFIEDAPLTAIQLLPLIPEYGRWDDFYSFIDTPLEDNVWEIIETQLQQDLKANNPSLLAKWLKSENTSSAESRYLAKRTREALGMNSKQYRKMLSQLRKKIDIVERKMSSNDWSEINYEQVPSKAATQYRHAFIRHDNARYAKYIQEVLSGEKKINTQTLYPSDIVGRVMKGDTGDTLQAAWENLPDYFNGKEMNGIVVADVSGSMLGRPIEVAIAIAMYIAEHNKGTFNNKFITFSQEPQLRTIQGETIFQRVHSIEHSDWGVNTNIESVFDLLLEAATRYNLPQSELPERVIIVSDMEFDEASCTETTNTLFVDIHEQWVRAGYRMPRLVFWNVDARNNQLPMRMEDNVQFVSGYSPSILTALLAGEFLNPVDLMLSVLNGNRYNNIVI